MEAPQVKESLQIYEDDKVRYSSASNCWRRQIIVALRKKGKEVAVRATVQAPEDSRREPTLANDCLLVVPCTYPEVSSSDGRDKAGDGAVTQNFKTAVRLWLSEGFEQ